MKTFHIQKPDEAIKEALIDKINNLTKPKGSLGRLEEIALQIGLIQQSLSPRLTHPQNIIFAADHGIVEEKVSPSPKEVTWQQISNFLHGGAGINFLCRQHGFTLKIVDAGVDYDLPYEKGIINMKVGRGTRNFLHKAAMTPEEMELCLEHGAQCVDTSHQEGCNIISFGEMGIGNTSSSSLWMTCFTGIPLDQCVGAGSGLNHQGINHKYEVLKRSLEQYPGEHSAEEILCRFGGYEMVMAVGAMLKAAELGMVILIDGFIMTNCILAASRLYPEVMSYAIFGHQGDESGHKLLLDYLGARPLLNLGLRLGEGSGSVCAYPIVDSAVKMLNEMDKVDGIKWALGLDSLIGPSVPASMIPDSVTRSLKNDKYQLVLANSEYKVATDELNDQIKELNTILHKYDEGGMLIGEGPLTADLIDITDKDFKTVSAVSIGIIFVIIMLLFKSISLPIILVGVIEFAIFVNMGIPYYMGTKLPFVASIVIGTIQLGSTVDYAILMTTRYKRERNHGANKYDSITTAHRVSAQSIMVSALSFFAATIGVGLYSNIDMISSLCILMARGALISMVVVIFVLPSMFMVFDKVIVKTSKGFLP